MSRVMVVISTVCVTLAWFASVVPGGENPAMKEVVVRKKPGFYKVIMDHGYQVIATNGRRFEYGGVEKAIALVRFLEGLGLKERSAVEEMLEIWCAISSSQSTEDMKPFLKLKKEGFVGRSVSLVVKGDGRYVYDQRIYAQRIGTHPSYFEEHNLPMGCLISVKRILVDLKKDKVEFLSTEKFIVTEDGRLFLESDTMFIELKGAEESTWVRLL